MTVHPKQTHETNLEIYLQVVSQGSKFPNKKALVTKTLKGQRLWRDSSKRKFSAEKPVDTFAILPGNLSQIHPFITDSSCFPCYHSNHSAKLSASPEPGSPSHQLPPARSQCQPNPSARHYMHTCMHVYIYLHAHTWIHTYIHIHVYTHTHAPGWLYIGNMSGNLYGCPSVSTGHGFQDPRRIPKPTDVQVPCISAVVQSGPRICSSASADTESWPYTCMMTNKISCIWRKELSSMRRA